MRMLIRVVPSFRNSLGCAVNTPPNFRALQRSRWSQTANADRGEAQALGSRQMALAVALLSLGACREGWTPLESRCIYQTAGQLEVSACAADCASVVRPWVANDTGGVPMCIKSQDEYDFLHTWVGRDVVYWTGFRRQGFGDGVVPPADWRTAVVHPQGAACSAGANPWFDSLMSHQRASPLLEHCTARPASHLRLRGCTATMEDHPVWSLDEPSTTGEVLTNFADSNGEQNCIFHEKNDWRQWIAMKLGHSPSSGYWCAEATTETDPHRLPSGDG